MTRKILILYSAVIACFLFAGNSYGAEKPKVTFVELGSVNCVPCKMMQPVMKKVESKYGSQVKVVFYDVWTDKDKKMSEVYRIRAIPTQVFLDADGKEYARHEGYFPFEDLEKVLNQKGVK